MADEDRKNRALCCGFRKTLATVDEQAYIKTLSPRVGTEVAKRGGL
jgi:hypothetical protein